MPVPNFRIQAFFICDIFSNQVLNNLFVNHFNFAFCVTGSPVRPYAKMNLFELSIM